MNNQNQYQGYYQPQQPANLAPSGQQVPQYGGQQVPQSGSQPVSQQQQPWQNNGQPANYQQNQAVTTQSTTTSYTHQGYSYQQPPQLTPQYYNQLQPSAAQAPSVHPQYAPAQQPQYAAQQQFQPTYQYQAQQAVSQTPLGYQQAPQPQQPLPVPVQQAATQTSLRYQQVPQPQHPQPVLVQKQVPAIDYDSLKVTARPEVPAIDYDSLKVTAKPEPPAAQSSATRNTMPNTHTQTMVYKGSTSGGKARKAAEARGEVRQFEDRIRHMLASTRGSGCRAGFQWYATEEGYLCGGGDHIVHHTAIDAWANNPRMVVPEVLPTNCSIPGSTGYICHPPPVDFWQPMHQTHAAFVNMIRADMRMGRGWEGTTGACDCLKGIVHKARHSRGKRQEAQDAQDRSAYGYRLGS
ncbi:hypothetical protein LTR08_004050 [Meristemomyces frigidus]|nr:hypothetical protein LTR08_004050 [Meristemomyces frigidus]